MSHNGDDAHHYHSDGDTTGDMEPMPQTHYQPDGSVVVMDTLPKKDYYRSLRNDGQGTVTRRADGAPQSTYATNQMSEAEVFKPSGKIVECNVIMLDGTEETFTIDKASNGLQLFDAVCDYLDLAEREYFGITFKINTTWYWLQNDKSIAKQIGKAKWQFEFQVKFYPPNIKDIKEDLTRYYLCLQVRQDIVSGQLPCSFTTYVLLGAYVVQSEAGDYDPAQHFGTQYIQHQPFAPQQLQTQEMLERIVELHRMNRGQTPEEADKNFLDNARKLAMYGVDMHKAKDNNHEDVSIGIYHGGVLVYRGRLRINRFSWPRIVKISYKGKHFNLSVRPFDDNQSTVHISYKCKEEDLAKRLWKACVEHHAFFRLRESEGPRKPNLLPGFGTRKYHYSGPTLQQVTSIPADRPQPRFKRVPTQRKPVDDHGKGAWFDTVNKQGGPVGQAPFAHSEGGTTAPSQMDKQYTRPAFDIEHWRMSPSDCTHGLGMDEKGLDIAASHGAGWQGCRSNKGIKSPGQYYYEASVVEDGLARLGWSTNDSSLELGADNEGFGYGSDHSGYGRHGKGRKMNRNEADNYGDELKEGDVVGCYIDLDQGMVQWSKNGNVFGPAFEIPDQLKQDPFFPAATLKDARVEFNFGDQPFKYYPRGPWVPVSQSSDEHQVKNKNNGWKMNPYDATEQIDVAPNGLGLQSHLGKDWQGCRSNKGVCGAGKYYYEVSPLEAGLNRVGWSTDDASLRLGTDKYGFGYGADKEGFGLNGTQGKRLHKDDIDNYGEAFGKNDTIGCFIDLDKGIIKWSKNGKDFGDAYKIPDDLLSTTAFFPTASMKDSTLDFNFGDKPFKYYPGEEWLPVAYTAEGNTRSSKRKGPELSLHHTNARSTDRQEDVLNKNPNVVVVKPKPRTHVPHEHEGQGDEDVIGTSRTTTHVTNGEYTSVEKDDPEVITETYTDEEGNLIKRTVKKTRVVTTKQSTRLITERSENEFSASDHNKHVVQRKALQTFEYIKDDDDDALTAAILSVTGFDPETSVLNETLHDVEIRGNKTESAV